MIVKAKVKESRLTMNGRSSIQLIYNNDFLYTVLGNVRTEEGDFEAYYHCSFCDMKAKKYTPKLLVIPDTGKRICRDCLCNFEEVIKAATLDDCAKGRTENE